MDCQSDLIRRTKPLGPVQYQRATQADIRGNGFAVRAGTQRHIPEGSYLSFNGGMPVGIQSFLGDAMYVPKTDAAAVPTVVSARGWADLPLEGVVNRPGWRVIYTSRCVPRTMFIPRVGCIFRQAARCRDGPLDWDAVMASPGYRELLLVNFKRRHRAGRMNGRYAAGYRGCRFSSGGAGTLPLDKSTNPGLAFR